MSKHGRRSRAKSRRHVPRPCSWHDVTLTYDGRYSCLYLDGTKVYEKDWATTIGLIHPPSSYVCIAYCPGVVQFNGYLDDLTLWNRSLSQGEIRAQYYMDRGLNGIVVPRGLFFNSEFFESLNTTTWSYSNPLLGSMVMGNDNPRELNSRVVQQLIAANLTLEEAWTWLNKLMKNETGKVTSFPLVVTSEIYTIGFDAMLMNVLPNMTVENSGNSSVPPPPVRKPTGWEALWNSFTGFVSMVWNAVVAVAVFVANVVAAVVKWGIGLAVAIASGQGLQYFYDTVVKPFVELVLAFIRWIIDLFIGMVRFVFDLVVKPIAGALRSWGGQVVAAMSRAVRDPQAVVSTLTNELASLLLGSGVFFAFLGLLAAVSVIEIITKPLLGLVADAVAFVVKVVTGIVLMALIGLSIPEILGQQTNVPPEVDGAIATSFTVSEFAIALGMSLALFTRTLEPLKAFALISLAVSLVGITLLFVRESVLTGKDRNTYGWRILVDTAELGVVTYAQLRVKSPGMVRQWYKVLDSVDNALGVIGIGWGFLNLAEDVSQFARAPS